MYLGDLAEDQFLYFTFTTRNSSGVPTTLSGTPVLSVYKDNNTTQSTAGITLTADFDSVTGLNHVAIDLSADAFYETGADYSVVITTGTVDSASVVGETVATFSIENRFEEVTLSAKTHTGATVPTVTDVTNQVEADVTAVSGDSTAADNLELDYDGTGYDKSNSTIGTTTNNTDMRGTDGAALAANYNATRAGYLDNLDGHTAQTGDTYALASGATGFTAIDTVVDAIKAVTDNLPNSGALTSISTDITSILADTNELQSDDIPSLISALNDITVSDILTASLTVAIAADGATPTLQQAIVELLQFLTDFTISGTTYTSKARDGSTTLGTYTLDDATTPTGITRG